MKCRNEMKRMGMDYILYWSLSRDEIILYFFVSGYGDRWLFSVIRKNWRTSNRDCMWKNEREREGTFIEH